MCQWWHRRQSFVIWLAPAPPILAIVGAGAYCCCSCWRWRLLFLQWLESNIDSPTISVSDGAADSFRVGASYSSSCWRRSLPFLQLLTRAPLACVVTVDACVSRLCRDWRRCLLCVQWYYAPPGAYRFVQWLTQAPTVCAVVVTRPAAPSICIGVDASAYRVRGGCYAPPRAYRLYSCWRRRLRCVR
jgi:hypothetical protein